MINVRVDNIPVQSNSVIKQCIDRRHRVTWCPNEESFLILLLQTRKARRFSNLDKCFPESPDSLLDETVELEENMLIQEAAEIMEYPQKFVSECPTSARFVETVEPLDMSNFVLVGRSLETAETREKSNVSRISSR
ncbi:hypothetical protein OIU84_029060 [Salix udensis]|uniref:Uncharacterized protein n=1 Tax=Salix udensis TaxID=889485 RepID=A0AAD6KE58_9ROSI|nr:hypothetical protein OIU84_029060 [Salix udensis]